MYCTSCGSPRADNATACPSCGTRVQYLPARPPIQNYLIPAILTTVCCCPAVGIVAIVYAAQVNSKLVAGDVTGAMESARNAKMWSWIAAGAGALLAIGYLVVTALAVAGSK